MRSSGCTWESEDATCNIRPHLSHRIAMIFLIVVIGSQNSSFA